MLPPAPTPDPPPPPAAVNTDAFLVDDADDVNVPELQPERASTLEILDAVLPPATGGTETVSGASYTPDLAPAAPKLSGEMPADLRPDTPPEQASTSQPDEVSPGRTCPAVVDLSEE